MMMRPPYALGPMPTGRRLVQVDLGEADAPIAVMHRFAADVERWPEHLAHYRFVRFRERATDGGGLVEMSANRPFGPVGWPTWWLSEMEVRPDVPCVRFRHVGGVTTGMDVEWRYEPLDGGRRTRIVLEHVWDGPRWPLIGPVAATMVIGPVFVHGIAIRTMAGLAAAAVRAARTEGR
jgi:hypothetical protein